MWINPMLTIWLYGTIVSLVTIIVLVWLWYWRNPDDNGTSGRHRGHSVQHAHDAERSAGHAGQ